MLLRVMRRADFSDSSDEQIEMNSGKKQLPKVGLKQWLHSVSHGQSQNNQYTKKLVLNFLVSEGYFEIAKTFSEEADIPMGEWANEEQVCTRYEIKGLIKKGEIDEALINITKLDPQFCTRPENEWTLFMMKCLKVINFIKKNQFELAIKTGKEELLPFSGKGQKYLTEIERVMSLIAFVNVKDCPHSQLASPEHSNNIANMINKNIFSMKSQQKGDIQNTESLEMVLKMGKWCEKQLGSYLKFPKFNFDSSEQLFTEEK